MDAVDALDHLASYGTPPNGEVALALSAGLDDFLTRLKAEILPHIAAGGAELRFVEAPYGRGKSHLLMAIEALALRENFVTAYVDCTTNAKPFGSLRDTYDAVVGKLRHRSVDGRGAAEIISSATRLNYGDARFKDFVKNPFLHPEFRNLAFALGNDYIRPSDRPGLRGQLIALLNDSASDYVNVPNLYRLQPGLPRPLGPIRPKNASLWLRSLCNLPHALGFNGLVLLFDETEQVLSIANERPAKRMEHFANLRNLADHVATGSLRGCLILYAVVEDFLDKARQDLNALAQRIERVRLRQDEERLPNPRAVWASLDELTIPDTGQAAFYDRLLENLLQLGKDAGLPHDEAPRIQLEALQYFPHQHINQGAVRNFVKRTATCIVERL